MAATRGARATINVNVFSVSTTGLSKPKYFPPLGFPIVTPAGRVITPGRLGNFLGGENEERPDLKCVVFVTL